MKKSEKSYFDSFREVVKAVSSTLDLQEVMDLIVNNMVKTMNLKASAVRLLHPKKRTLELLAAAGLSEKYIGKGPVDAERSIAEAMKGRIVIIDNAGQDSRAQYQKEAKEEGIATIVSIPLAIKGRTIGVLRLYTGEPRKFKGDDLKFAEALAEIGAIAIENARMYESIKKDYESVMNDIHGFVGYRRTI